MTNVKISDMTPGTTPLAGSELFEATQGGNTVSLEASDIGFSFTTDAANIVPVASGGTGAATLTGYVKGAGTSAFTAATTIPQADISAVQYGYFAQLVDQTAVVNTATPTLFGTTVVNNGITIANNGGGLATRITVAAAGKYSFEPALRFVNNSATVYTASMWYQINGADVANSNTDMSVPVASGGVNGMRLGATPMVLTLAANDYVEIDWSTPNTALFLDYTAAQVTPTRPASPSASVVVRRITA